MSIDAGLWVNTFDAVSSWHQRYTLEKNIAHVVRSLSEYDRAVVYLWKEVLILYGGKFYLGASRE